MNSNTEQIETTQAKAEPAKAAKKANIAKRARHVAPSKAKSGKKANKANKAPKGAKKASGARDGSKAARKGVRDGSKTETILELLKRAGGATAKELMKATGWQPHSVRGFLSGTVGKKMGLSVTSTKGEDGERTYSVKP